LHREHSRRTPGRQTAAVTQPCYRRGGFFEGCDSRREEGEGRFNGSGAGDASPRNAANPRIGSGMQQARELRAEKTVAVVRNHEGGTRLSPATTSREGGNTPARRRSERCRWKGARRIPREAAEASARVAWMASQRTRSDHEGPQDRATGQGGMHARTSKVGSGDRPRPRRSQERPTTCQRASCRDVQFRRMHNALTPPQGVNPTNLEGRANLTEARKGDFATRATA
jgi:hypothetical protein